MRGEKIYEYDLDVTGVTDYGISLDAILSGQLQIPPQGGLCGRQDSHHCVHAVSLGHHSLQRKDSHVAAADGPAGWVKRLRACQC
jgi:hypothetical protein